jgi:exodeoxyribonuclease III
MKVTTWNVNGVRARAGQVLEWIHLEQPEIVCLQEIKASPADIPERLCTLENYWCFWHGHKGYSGVGINLRKDAWPEEPRFFHPAFDEENRIVAVRLGSLLVASVYVPNGNKDFPAKMRFLEEMVGFVRSELAAGSTLLLCGDLNVALEERDVHPLMRKAEQIGQRPEERALIQALLDASLTDLLRRFDPDNDRLFTWWAPWRNFRQRNYGWRLDYVLASAPLAASAKRCVVFREFGTSDHGPVLAEFDTSLALFASGGGVRRDGNQVEGRPAQIASGPRQYSLDFDRRSS